MKKGSWGTVTTEVCRVGGGPNDRGRVGCSVLRINLYTNVPRHRILGSYFRREGIFLQVPKSYHIVLTVEILKWIDGWSIGGVVCRGHQGHETGP